LATRAYKTLELITPVVTSKQTDKMDADRKQNKPTNTIEQNDNMLNKLNKHYIKTTQQQTLLSDICDCIYINQSIKKFL